MSRPSMRRCSVSASVALEEAPFTQKPEAVTEEAPDAPEGAAGSSRRWSRLRVQLTQQHLVLKHGHNHEHKGGVL